MNNLFKFIIFSFINILVLLNVIISLLIIKFIKIVLSINIIIKKLIIIKIIKLNNIFIDKENISFEANEVI